MSITSVASTIDTIKKQKFRVGKLSKSYFNYVVVVCIANAFLLVNKSNSVQGCFS